MHFFQDFWTHRIVRNSLVIIDSFQQYFNDHWCSQDIFWNSEQIKDIRVKQTFSISNEEVLSQVIKIYHNSTKENDILNLVKYYLTAQI